MERTSSSYPLPVPSLLAVAAVLKGILENIDAVRAKEVLRADGGEERGKEKRNSFFGTDDGRRRFDTANVERSKKMLAAGTVAATGAVSMSGTASEAATYVGTTTARSNGAETAAANAVTGAWRLDIGETPPPSISQAQREHTVMQVRKHEQGKQHERQHMQEQPGQQKERPQVQFQSYEREQRLEQPFFDEEQYLRQKKDVLHAQCAIPTPASHPTLALPHGHPPSRRPGRPFRKREKRRSPPEDYHCDATGASNRENLPLLMAVNFSDLDAKGTCTYVRNGTTVANWRGRPQSSLLQRLQRTPQQQGIDPAARLATDSAAPPYSSPAPTILAKSTTRVLSSETYLRRLFVTALLAHVLSLDEHLPRSMAAKRAVSSRTGVRGCGGGGGDAEAGGENRREIVLCGETRGYVSGGGERGATGHGEGHLEVETCNATTTGIDCSADTTKRPPRPPLSLSTHDGNVGPFKKYFPVMLVDNAGRRWSMMYETTRRDNLHSGRLVDGWESFCFANGLRIGDQVEFTRVEAPDRQQDGLMGKKAVALVAACRKHARLRELGV